MLLGHGEIGGCWWCAFCFLLSALYDRDAIATDEHGLARMNRTVRDWAHAKPRSREAAKGKAAKGKAAKGKVAGAGHGCCWAKEKSVDAAVALSAFSCLHSVAGMPSPRMNTDLHG
jgi:hypothetical protein